MSEPSKTVLKTVDHKELADDLLRRAQGWEPGNPWRADMLARAQIHATLHVAEQVRQSESRIRKTIAGQVAGV